MPCFNSTSSFPYTDVNLRNEIAHAVSTERYTNEVTTLQLEFRDLSRITKNGKYEEAAFRITKKVHEMKKLDGLVPMIVEADNETFREFSVVTLGNKTDSYYEYLLKQWIQTGKKDDDLYEKMLDWRVLNQ